MTLKDFIEQYLAEHSLSMREFAKQAGVSVNTVSRWTSGELIESPDVQTLIKVARFTGYDPLLLIEIAYGDDIKTNQPDPSARILATRISRLPKFIRDGLEKLIDGYLKNL